MSVREEVRLLAMDLPLGETMKGICPRCEGGSSNEASFSITRDASNVLLYNCYRASCPTGGAVHVSGELIQTKWKPRSIINFYTGERLPLRPEDIAYFYNRFGINKSAAAKFISRTERGEYLFPVMSPQQYERGFVVRQPAWKGIKPPNSPVVGKKKAILYPHNDAPMQSWYFSKSARYASTVVIVEDALSAIRVAQAGMTGVALLGASLNNDTVREIAHYKPKEVILALDADATDQAFRLGRKYGLAFPNFRVAILEEDLKDTTFVNAALGIRRDG